MTSYRGAWLYGHEHVSVLVGRLKAEWEQFCPIPADINDGVLIRGNVLYRKADGGWQKSNDLFEGVLRTEHGRGGSRHFIGKTQHTFTGPKLPNGRLTVLASLDIPLAGKSPQNPLIPVQNTGQNANNNYRQNNYNPPALSYPSYESGDYGAGF